MGHKVNSLAFKITNDLLNAGVIVGGIAASAVESIVRQRLTSEGVDRAAIIHFQDASFTEIYGICHQNGSTNATSERERVTCVKCLRIMAR